MKIYEGMTGRGTFIRVLAESAAAAFEMLSLLHDTKPSKLWVMDYRGCVLAEVGDVFDE